jgi:hypothetical protein
MKRRDFLATGLAVAEVLAARAVLAQAGASMTRAAVVIGVDKSGDLPILSAAVSGARKIADWLKSEGFEVKVFVDDGAPVELSKIFAAIDEFVDRGNLDQLVVYFSGHGFLISASEHWMLSQAPHNPNETISLVESVYLARECGIPSVIFIADTCRSTPESLGAKSTRGGFIFPSLPVNTLRPEIDQFFATLPGDPAQELKVADSIASFEGIYTASFLEAFQHPDDDMVVTTIDGERVVPNRRLRSYLLREVQEKAAAESITRQIPDAIIESGEQIYIGRAPATGALPAQRWATATIVDVAGLELERAGTSPLGSVYTRLPAEVDPEEVDRVAVVTGFATARDKILAVQDPTLLHSITLQTGVIVYGARLTLAMASPEMRAEVQAAGDGFQEPAIIRLQPVETRGRDAASVILRFDDGAGTVIGSFVDYIGAVIVDDGRVVNVSYVPSSSNWRRSDYEQQRERLDQLRAVVATTARFGVFRIEGEREARTQRAEQLADNIRVLKGIDPTLGLMRLTPTLRPIS